MTALHTQRRHRNSPNPGRLAFGVKFAAILQDVLRVIESSSVWYEVFRFIRDGLDYEVTLSNSAQTKATGASKKTDKVDTHVLDDLLHGGCVAKSHVPDRNLPVRFGLGRHSRRRGGGCFGMSPPLH